jgi:hypothetical protein
MKRIKLIEALESKVLKVKFPTHQVGKSDFETFTDDLKEAVEANLSVRRWESFEYDTFERKYFLTFRFAGKIYGIMGIFEHREIIDPELPNLKMQIMEMDSRLLNLIKNLNKSCD